MIHFMAQLYRIIYSAAYPSADNCLRLRNVGQGYRHNNKIPSNSFQVVDPTFISFRIGSLRLAFVQLPNQRPTIEKTNQDQQDLFSCQQQGEFKVNIVTLGWFWAI